MVKISGQEQSEFKSSELPNPNVKVSCSFTVVKGCKWSKIFGDLTLPGWNHQGPFNRFLDFTYNQSKIILAYDFDCNSFF